MTLFKNGSELFVERVPEGSFGKCKCCLSERQLKILWTEHNFEGEGENYGQMLNECFSLSWPTKVSELICEQCISRLRDATDFRREIIATKELLEEGVDVKKERIAESGVYPDDIEYVPEAVPVEEIKEEVVEVPVEYLEDEEYVPEDIPSSSQASSPEPRKRKYPPKKQKSERNKTYKQYSRNSLLEAVKKVCSGELTCAEASLNYGVPVATVLAKFHEAESEKNGVNKAKEASNEKHYNLIEDIQKLLKYTNAIPFKTKANRYYCFYCSTDGQIFEEPDDLREHTNTVHSDERIDGIEHYMKPQWSNEVIKMDVHRLHCTECLIRLPDWNNMFVHFAETHKVGFDEAYTKVIPYPLTTDLKCVLCDKPFNNFALLDAHMNLHYSNHICHACGDTFLSTSRLEKHLLVHKTGSFPCMMCDKVFTLEKYVSKHYTLVHEPKCATKCLYCTEKFIGPLQRHAHVCEKHKDKVKTYTCELCGKVFTWRAYFLAHMRKRHYGVKKYKCPHCSKMFLMQYELKSHMITHTRQRKFVCGECKQTFPRIHLLRKHLVENHPRNFLN